MVHKYAKPTRIEWCIPNSIVIVELSRAECAIDCAYLGVNQVAHFRNELLNLIVQKDCRKVDIGLARPLFETCEAVMDMLLKSVRSGKHQLFDLPFEQSN
jgi:hypothetical protein